MSDVLGLLVASRAIDCRRQDGHYIADQLKPFIDRVRSLLQTENFGADKKAPLWIAFADALGTYGAQGGDAQSLAEAVAAYREALKEYTRERVPLDWAMTQNNLGSALKVLGERAADPARLEQAVAVYREALKERTRERVPLDWAMTQNNLGNALEDLREHASDTAQLEDAISSFTLAHAVYRAAQEEWRLSEIESNRKHAQTVFAEIRARTCLQRRNDDTRAVTYNSRWTNVLRWIAALIVGHGTKTSC